MQTDQWCAVLLAGGSIVIIYNAVPVTSFKSLWSWVAEEFTYPQWDYRAQEMLPLFRTLTSEAKRTLYLLRAPSPHSLWVVVGLFEEKEEEIGITSDVVKVKGDDPAIPGSARGQKVRWYVGDPFPSRGWCSFYYFVRNSLVALLEALCAVGMYSLARPWGSSGTVTIPQYRFNKT